MRWRELFRLKRQQHKKGTTKNPNPNPLNRSSLTPSILQDFNSESISASSCLSSSSSSSSDTDNGEIHRLRLKNHRASDSEAVLESQRLNSSGRVMFMGLERSSSSPGSFNRGSEGPTPGDGALLLSWIQSRPRAQCVGVWPRPTVHSSEEGEGGDQDRQWKTRGMERSYLAEFRVASVLNVSVFGLGQLFIPQKKEREGTRIGNGNTRNKIKRERD